MVVLLYLYCHICITVSMMAMLAVLLYRGVSYALNPLTQRGCYDGGCDYDGDAVYVRQQG